MVTSPNQPRLRIQLQIALMSTVPEDVLLVRTNEYTLLAPFDPRYTLHVWPPTVAVVWKLPSGPTAPYLFIHNMISWALSLDHTSYALVNATPLVGTVTLNELLSVPSALIRLPDRLVALG